MRDIKRYKVFTMSHQLALEIYKIAATFPKDETFGFRSQIRRAAYSIPMNLAEGAARSSSGGFCQFVNVALGSCEELRYRLVLARDLGYIKDSVYQPLESRYEEVKKVLSALYAKLKQRR
jgi:four helix bundle protein